MTATSASRHHSAASSTTSSSEASRFSFYASPTFLSLKITHFVVSALQFCKSLFSSLLFKTLSFFIMDGIFRDDDIFDFDDVRSNRDLDEDIRVEERVYFVSYRSVFEEFTSFVWLVAVGRQEVFFFFAIFIYRLGLSSDLVFT